MNCERPHPEFHSESNGTSCQSLQLRESRNGTGITRGWITEAEWTIYIEENSIDDPRSLSDVSIFRVPYLLKKSKIEFYVPQTVSLGPYHHRSAELHDLMSSHKGRALHLTRTSFNYRNLANDPNNMHFAHRARDEIMKLEEEMRDSYKEKIDCDGKTLALILNLMRTRFNDVRNLANDPNNMDFAHRAMEELEKEISDIYKEKIDCDGKNLAVWLNLMRTRFNDVRNLAYDPNMDFAHRAMGEIVKLEKEIRDSYKEKIDCDEKTLALMLSLDGCFILQILRAYSGHRASNCYEPMFEKAYITYSGKDILDDIVKLENQIPMIVLQKLLQLELDSLDTQDYLLKILRRLLGRFYPVDSKERERLWLWPQGVVHHILGLMHSFIVSSLYDHDDRVDESDLSAWRKWFKWSCVWSNLGKCISLWSKYMKCGNEWCSAIKWCRKDSAVNNFRLIGGAVELKNAGIKFKVCGAAGGTRMIKFDPKNATIFLPWIQIQDSTEVLFRNLIAFELCKPSQINYVTCYVALMDELINTGEDVALLIRSGIVTNFLGSDAEVAELFNGLCKDVTASKDVFETLKEDVHEHYGNVRKVQLAGLVTDHFSSPWKTVAFAVAILIALFSTVQTIFSVLSYYK